ncbi:rhamnogalacturonyl hydrolase YesR [Duganella sp. 1411]|uniref:glycoside hydrolase family 88/105 protein n=1 Tax=Duganella sp. 1411 TaxID=2806572 RepID=UPI001AE4DEFC|nr:glycoside hydrolase family 88 protein [Duganella sp. 1411]MBP1202345.1 rhamnogalacturonyl hydrolase YesR [Duganella sp. 1411]
MKVKLLLKKTAIAAMLLPLACQAWAETKPANDMTAPLHLMKADYPTPYGNPSVDDVSKVLDRVFTYLDAATPTQAINAKTKKEITNFNQIDDDTVFAPGDFRLTSYEWGVTYAGMLAAGGATGDKRYKDYVNKRLTLLANLAPATLARMKSNPQSKSPVRGMLEPHALDDIGAVCAAIVKAKREGLQADVKPLLDSCVTFIRTKEHRLSDGTLARVRPQVDTLWLDDLFMAVPALAQLGKLTGDASYYDDAVKQVEQFSKRMFNERKGIYMHGWVQGMDVHPEFHWARANGWAVMTMVELLDVLPKDHPGYPMVLKQLRAHVKGLASYQDGTGLWHQLLDRNDTYLETSATAIYAYSMARAINKGYIDKMAYAPAVMLAWNAAATKVNAKGQVEGVCVGTGMGFDPAFYAYRPVNVYAAHGYGPVLLAGAEIITMLKTNKFEINDSSLQLLVK